MTYPYDAWFSDSVNTVEEVAQYTDMQGAESTANMQAARSAAFKQSPSKMLMALWFLCVLLYALVSFLFRNHLA